ncbi:MAG: hypothetical protein WBD22_14535, partial [Pyrinomonadaceae bacterium]
MTRKVLHDGDEGVTLIVKERSRKSTPEMRQPVHVVYGGANLFRADTPTKLGRIALDSIESYTSNFVEFSNAFGHPLAEMLPRSSKAVDSLVKKLTDNPAGIKASNFPAWLAWTVYQRTRAKLSAEPVEDFRIDFEDGYGTRPDDEEDGHAIGASSELAKAYNKGTITAFSGFRIKSLAPETLARGVHTLNRFLDNFLEQTGGKLPSNFAVTLPKVSSTSEVKELGRLLRRIEKKWGLKEGRISIELMIETPQAIIDKKGRVPLGELIKAGKGRCTSAHFGAYDYTAALGISAAHQHLRHSACHFARLTMLTT